VSVTSCPDAIARVIKKYIDAESNGNGNKPFSQDALSNVTATKPALTALTSKTNDDDTKSRSVEQPGSVLASNTCPDCGMPIQHESGCIVCIHCGYSKCE